MAESTIVRAAIIVYVVIVVIALALLWLNAAASDALKNTGILAAAILPVLIAVLPYINVQEESYQYSFILLYDSKTRALTTGDHWNSYEPLYMHMFTNLSRAPTETITGDLNDFQAKKGLDVIEKGIIEALMIRFGSHWDVVWHENRGPNYISFSGGKGATGTSKQVSLVQIKKAFSYNDLISAPDVIVGSGFHIPPGGTLKTSQSNASRVIAITTPYSTVSINVRSASSSVAQQGVWGVLKPDPQNVNRYYTIAYAVSLTIKLKRFKKYSPAIGPYSCWHENIKGALQRYDWEEVDNHIEQTMMRKAVLEKTENPSESSKGSQ